MSEVLDLTLGSDNEDDIESPPRIYAPAGTGAASVKSENEHPRPPSQAPRSRFNNDPNAPKTTVVNGKGFWKSWTRSYKTTLLKLLDLIDNAVDGIMTQSTPGFTGRVHIYPDAYEQSITNREGKRKKYTSTTGLCIRNNSPGKIVPLSEALVVHNTTKVDAGEIGENGVGLKQACAALCDMSFVLVKNGSNADIELGIVAKSLQREEGPYLPAFQFSNERDEAKAPLREQMLSLFSQSKHDDVAQCIAQYGAVVSGNNPRLADGIDGICKHFDDMCHTFYGNDYVFEVILSKIRHGQIEGLAKRALDAQQKITVNQLLQDLQREIPRTYLHIPDSFEFIVGKSKLLFKYWQERLVELSTFTVAIGSTISWKQNFETSDEHPDSYDLRLFLGFDRFRIAESDVEANTGEKKEGKCASLYFYSRQSGRLIKSESDARQMLGLTSGSTMFSSALTIIIDDISGCLPLHPTKQDLSFGLENKGAVHEENLFAWVGSVTKFYYRYHLKKYNNLKKILSAKISHYVDSTLPKEPKSYDESEFTTFELTYEEYRNTIQVDAKLAKEMVGRDTYFRLLPETVNSMAKGKGKKRSRSSKEKKLSGSKSGEQPSSCVAAKTAKRARTQPLSYREESDSDSNADASLDTSKDERGQGSESNSQKKPTWKNSGQQGTKGSRPQVDSYWQKADPYSDLEANVKMEAAVANKKFKNGFSCVDLCESSDEESDEVPPIKNNHVGKHRGANTAPDTDIGAKSKPASSQSFTADRRKIEALQQTIKQLRGESNSKIVSLRIENEELKKQLLQSERVISVLKRRLGA